MFQRDMDNRVDLLILFATLNLVFSQFLYDNLIQKMEHRVECEELYLSNELL